MTRTSPAHAQLPPDAVWEAVDGMPVPVHATAQPATWLVDVSPLRRWLVRGGQGGEWLTAKGLDVPDGYFLVGDAGGTAFIVRTGAAEYFLHDGPGRSLASALGEIPEGVVGDMRIAARDDLEVVLGGAQASRILAEVCALDLSNAQGRFLLTRVAGVSAWLCVEEDAQGVRFRIGCDPSYGAFLFETLAQIVGEQGGGTIGFHDFHNFLPGGR
jgi:sarcosine oxidase subunit gamma